MSSLSKLLCAAIKFGALSDSPQKATNVFQARRAGTLTNIDPIDRFERGRCMQELRSLTA
jgi:hypothetical protein